MNYTTEFISFLLAHYQQRLNEELDKGNTGAVVFLRQTLHNLKSKQ